MSKVVTHISLAPTHPYSLNPLVCVNCLSIQILSDVPQGALVNAHHVVLLGATPASPRIEAPVGHHHHSPASHWVQPPKLSSHHGASPE